MNLPRQQLPLRAPGYTLVELLLTTSLLLLFAGLAIVSMQTLNQGSAFAEGTVRFETMVRYAHAEAARSGHRVRIDFVQETNAVADLMGTNQLSQVRLSWEPNPATEPDVFQDLLGPRWGVDAVNESVRVVEVRLLDSAPDESTNAPDGQSLAAADSQPSPAAAPADPSPNPELAPPPGITFNPDGSCDAAEILLQGLPPEDDRRVLVRVDGITGTVTHKDVPASCDSTNSPAGGTNSPAAYSEKWPSS
jgi:hypothetical protein